MNKESIINEVKASLKTLNASKPFNNFNIKLSPEERNALNNIQIDIPKVYDNFGKLDNLTNELDAFIKSLNQNNNDISQSIATLITKWVIDVIVALKKETAWITIRASVATDLWDIPRWHTDGYYYPPYTGEQYKVVMTLKGPASLFYPLTNNTLREKFTWLQFDPENRKNIANMLDISYSVSAAHGQGTVYIVGTKYAAIHSEPPIHEERLFLSIVPGSKSDIQELYQNWHPKKNVII